eukprot:CAMPEP_0198647836 /NCGR_PEP_ID=MMETSP1467-20131203/3043_1 /TAXON_ID=1462469 /ORGANISM="unid. sp., Strain CCMP2135" /LENGTH=649 /DNA_ID=CAMNT_0044383503 /DNA_START=19 /DNA_END=1970 /DNA_ORIENTATION=-
MSAPAQQQEVTGGARRRGSFGSSIAARRHQRRSSSFKRGLKENSESASKLQTEVTPTNICSSEQQEDPTRKEGDEDDVAKQETQAKVTEPPKPQPEKTDEGKARRRASFGNSAAARRHFRTSSIRKRRSSQGEDLAQAGADDTVTDRDSNCSAFNDDETAPAVASLSAASEERSPSVSTTRPLPWLPLAGLLPPPVVSCFFCLSVCASASGVGFLPRPLVFRTPSGDDAGLFSTKTSRSSTYALSSSSEESRATTRGNFCCCPVFFHQPRSIASTKEVGRKSRAGVVQSESEEKHWESDQPPSFSSLVPSRVFIIRKSKEEGRRLRRAASNGEKRTIRWKSVFSVGAEEVGAGPFLKSVVVTAAVAVVGVLDDEGPADAGILADAGHDDVELAGVDGLEEGVDEEEGVALGVGPGDEAQHPDDVLVDEVVAEVAAQRGGEGGPIFVSIRRVVAGPEELVVGVDQDRRDAVGGAVEDDVADVAHDEGREKGDGAGVGRDFLADVFAASVIKENLQSAFHEDLEDELVHLDVVEGADLGPGLAHRPQEQHQETAHDLALVGLGEERKVALSVQPLRQSFFEFLRFRLRHVERRRRVHVVHHRQRQRVRELFHEVRHRKLEDVLLFFLVEERQVHDVVDQVRHGRHLGVAQQ